MAHTLSHTEAHNRTAARRALDLYEPSTLSVHSRRRFRRSRLAYFLDQLGERQPTPEEADIIAQIIRVAWDERIARSELETASDLRAKAELRRQINEHGRQQILLRRDLDRAAPKATPAAPEPRLADLLAEDTKRRERGEMA